MDDSPALRDCDIVMKGGITSGVVYPSAIRELSNEHRFRNIGGASVGAIAAAVTAAAEYGGQTGRGTGFREFDAIDEELGKDGFLLSLFKPRAEANCVYSIYLAVTQRAGAIGVAWAVLRNAPWFALVLIAWWLTLAAVVAGSGDFWWLVPLLLILWGVLACVWIWAIVGRVSLPGLTGLLLPLIWPCLTVLPWFGVRAWKDVSTNGFGLVPGSSEDGNRRAQSTEHSLRHVDAGRRFVNAGYQLLALESSKFPPVGQLPHRIVAFVVVGSMARYTPAIDDVVSGGNRLPCAPSMLSRDGNRGTRWPVFES